MGGTPSIDETASWLGSARVGSTGNGDIASFLRIWSLSARTNNSPNDYEPVCNVMHVEGSVFAMVMTLRCSAHLSTGLDNFVEDKGNQRTDRPMK